MQLQKILLLIIGETHCRKLVSKETNLIKLMLLDL
jgi:hypothetical protein